MKKAYEKYNGTNAFLGIVELTDEEVKEELAENRWRDWQDQIRLFAVKK